MRPARNTVKAPVEPVRIRRPMRPPIRPQTRITQATSGSVSTLTEVSAIPVTKPLPCSISSPAREPLSSDSIGRRVHMREAEHE
jgi:hypothetical protein